MVNDDPRDKGPAAYPPDHDAIAAGIRSEAGPDAQVLAYDTTYESTRADLQELPMSG